MSLDVEGYVAHFQKFSKVVSGHGFDVVAHPVLHNCARLAVALAPSRTDNMPMISRPASMIVKI